MIPPEGTCPRVDRDPLKPDYASFVLKPHLIIGVTAVPICLLVFLVVPVIGLILLLLTLISAGVLWFWRHVQYRKTEYTIGDEKIRVHTGTLFSDAETEVLWSKVVQAHAFRGILQKFLFGTGNVMLQAAGQAETEITLQDLPEPDGIFEGVLEAFVGKAAPLRGEDPRMSYRQAGSGILLDFFVPPLLLSLLVGGLTWAVLSLGAVPKLYDPLQYWVPAGSLAVFTLVFAVVAGVKATIAYHVYDEAVERTVDFLWSKRTVVPLRILSDVNRKEIVHKRPLGLANLTLSVPGAGEETTLVNLTNAPALQEELQGRSDRLKREDGRETTRRSKRFEARPDFLSTMAVPLLFFLVCAGVSGILTLALGRSAGPVRNEGLAFGIALLPLLVGLGWFGFKLVTFFASSFAVEGNRVELTFSFLNLTVTSLSTDKIKAIVKRQGIIERFFNTHSLVFHSIGTTDNITFFCLPDTQDNAEMLRHIRQHEGSYGGEVVESIDSSRSSLGLVFQNAGILLFPILLVVLSAALGLLGSGAAAATLATVGAAVGLAALAGTIAYLIFYYDNWVSLDLYDGYLVFHEGYFVTKDYYVVYPDIRNVEYGREPMSDHGWIQVDFASGPRRVQGSNNQGIQRALRHLIDQGAFTFQHVAGIEATGRALEDVFSGTIEPSRFQARLNELKRREDAVHRTAVPRAVPYVAQGMVYGLIPVFLLPEGMMDLAGVGLMTMVPLGGFLGWVYRNTIVYTIRDDRVEARHWVVLTRTKSIRYQNIDNIETEQGFWGKILSMGTVKISTTGGTGVEMKARFLPDHEAFYEALQAEYSEATTTGTI